MSRPTYTLHLVMAGCALFVALALGALAWVCLQPQTSEVLAREQAALARCWRRSEDPGRTSIHRHAQAESCREMHRQLLHKSGGNPGR